MTAVSVLWSLTKMQAASGAIGGALQTLATHSVHVQVKVDVLNCGGGGTVGTSQVQKPRMESPAIGKSEPPTTQSTPLGHCTCHVAAGNFVPKPSAAALKTALTQPRGSLLQSKPSLGKLKECQLNTLAKTQDVLKLNVWAHKAEEQQVQQHRETRCSNTEQGVYLGQLWVVNLGARTSQPMWVGFAGLGIDDANQYLLEFRQSGRRGSSIKTQITLFKGTSTSD